METKKVSFIVPGEPVGKARPRTVRLRTRGKDKEKVMTFTPEKTVIYENLVKTEYQQQCGDVSFTSGQLRMELRCYYGLAKSDSKKKRQAKLDGVIRPTKKPDIDNCIKAIADSLNGLAYTDDTQIVEVIAEKWFDEKPRVEVTIMAADEDNDQHNTGKEVKRHESILDLISQ